MIFEKGVVANILDNISYLSHELYPDLIVALHKLNTLDNNPDILWAIARIVDILPYFNVKIRSYRDSMIIRRSTYLLISHNKEH